MAASNGLDLANVFSYPLTTYPLSMAYIDGSINKTDKSKLLKKLEQKVESQRPDHIDACAVHAMFLIHAQKKLPVTFGRLAKHILAQLCEFASHFNFICDAYSSPSIKDLERDSRYTNTGHYSITGPEQKIPNNFQLALRSVTFKESLLHFLVTEWKKDSYVKQLAGHKPFVALD